jgi:prepilin-type processing-associated H-X9-DG protein
MEESSPGESMQPLDYAGPEAKTGLPIWMKITLWSAFGLFLISILIPSIGRPRETANRVKCASNLRQIGQAIASCTGDFHGQYPNNFGDLLLTEDITSSIFICPSANDLPAQGATTQETVTDLFNPGHCSYIFLGKGLTSATVQPDMVIALEPLTNHGGDGTNVLFGDGHVEFIDKIGAALIQPQIAAGSWPVYYPPRPATRAVASQSLTRP